jgi:hypothetical protein
MISMNRLCIFAVLSLFVSSAGCAAPSADDGSEESSSDLKGETVTLRVPLLDDKGELLSLHNPALLAGGLETFPDVVEISAGAKGALAKDATQAWGKASALVDKAYEALRLELGMRPPGEPSSYQTKDPKTTICYKGNPLLVANLVSNLADAVFSDQLGVSGWRYGQTKRLGADVTSRDAAKFPAAWKDWKGTGTDVLVITHATDGGSEANVGIIVKCAP